jgi:peptidase S24-like protein
MNLGSRFFSFRRIAVVLSIGVVAIFSGCSSTSETAAAPRSSVSREHALALANAMARTVGGEVFTIAATGSMKPTLDESSVVTIEKVAFDQLRRGDIIIYRNNRGLPIIHRLYEQHGSHWLVLGDNNASIDSEAVTGANFVGRVCAIFYTSDGTGPTTSAAFAQR